MIGTVVRDFALTQPNRPAIVSVDRKPLSYAGLQQQIEDVGQQLRRGGFTSESRIGVALLDGPEAVLLILAVASHATVVPINNNLSADELRQLFQQAGLDGIVLAQATAPHIRKMASDLAVTIIEAIPGRGLEIVCTVRVPATIGVAAIDPQPHSIALILQTSGTTGSPKLVPITHGNLVSEAAKMRDWFNLTPDDRCLSALPLYYAHGLREILFPPILTGGSIARPANHTEVDIAEWLGRLEPTWYSTFPIFHRAIHELIVGSGTRPAHQLRFVLSAGTPLQPQLQQGLERELGVPVLEFYGIGEAGHMSANLPMALKHKPGTCGVPLPGEIMIAGDGHPVPAGVLGEVFVRGPTVISGYLNSPAVNKDAFVDGWFRTGDLGTFDADGFLSIHGRYKELINRGGEKLSPIEVEQVLLRHPAVAEAAAFAVPHPRLGEDVAAAIVLRASITATSSELQRFARTHLASFKVPRFVEFVRELPKDVTGKVQRRELSAALASKAVALSAPGLHEPSCPLTADLMQLWRNLLQCESIGLDDDFFEVGGDSLLAVQMRLSVERMTGLILPGTIPFEAPTIRRFAQAVAECNQASPMPVITEHPNGGGRPFFYFHGDFLSGGLYVRRLAELLGDAVTVFSVIPHGLTRDPIPLSIQQMASERLPLILAAQPAGPFCLGGHCNGAAVAFETARLLRVAGHEVELLALIDMPTMNANPVMRLLRIVLSGLLRPFVSDAAKREALMATGMELVWRLHEKHRRVWQMEGTKRRARIAGKWKFYNNTLRQWIAGVLPFQRLASPFGPATSLPDNDLMQRTRRYFKVLAAFSPPSLGIPIVCYSAEHSGHHLKHVAAQLEIVKIPSDHFGCVTTHMHVVADHLRQRLMVPLCKPLAATAAVSTAPRAAADSENTEFGDLTASGKSQGGTSIYARVHHALGKPMA